MNSNFAVQSALSLAQLGNSRLLQAAQHLGTGNPDNILDGMVSLQQAKISVRTASILMRSQQEVDDAILDMFV